MYIIKKFFLLSLVLLAVTLLIPLKENQTLINVQNDVRSKVQQVMNQDSSVKNNALKTPKDQDIAINNIQMNMSKGKVERQLGQPKRITSNEYGTKWYAYYNNDYENFIMVSY
ncbi:CAP-associated domain-containing protein, partial [Staphylococcus haemolyticus]|uniref:CAP-associated domain-containing protein n=1 Tax=Staphylococcus haemolyticus TaxID=1283 RepID=UPI00214D9EED